MKSKEIAKSFTHNEKLLDKTVNIKMSDCQLKIKSNHDKVLEILENYFSACDVLDKDSDPVADPGIEIIVIQNSEFNFDENFNDWKREPGKTGRKDAYVDFADCRVIKKVRTGMLFLQSRSYRIAIGDAIEHDNQIINFINSQTMNYLQNNDWLICHASALWDQNNKNGIAIAGLSGGGKSTFMLKLLEQQGIQYLTNDRLFIKNETIQDFPKMLGIAKLPRINPGTIVGNQKLHPIMTKEQLSHYQKLTKEELWPIEEKYDVNLAEIYGSEKITQSGLLNHLIVLNWSKDSSDPTSINQVNLQHRQELLAAVMKSKGPFYQYPDGHFEHDEAIADKKIYLQALQSVQTYEVTGTIDFDSLVSAYKEISQ